MNAEIARDGVDGALYDRFALTILTYLGQQVSQEQDAEDLLLEVFLAACNNDALASLPAERQLAWLLRVARNKVVDRYRRRARLSLVPLELAGGLEDRALTPEQYMEQQEMYERLYLALERLSPLQQELIRLRYTNGLRFSEIARIFGKTEGAVRKLCVRTLQQLRGIYTRAEREKQR